MGKPVHSRSVEIAAQILGGNEAVATYLGVPLEDVISWAEGHTEPAVAFLLRMVELIEEKTVSAARMATVVRSRRDE